jgi:type II secretory pathway pseudopilin PulG
VKPSAGFSLLELSLALGLVALLGALAGAALPPANPALNAVQGELRASLEQAFLRARARGAPVRVALGGPVPACRGRHRDGNPIMGLSLPRGVRWGLPHAGFPLPPDMKPTARAHLTGLAHPCVTVSPTRSAEASTWFLTDGRDAVCLRVSPLGKLTLLRWRSRLGRWRME